MKRISESRIEENELFQSIVVVVSIEAESGDRVRQRLFTLYNLLHPKPPLHPRHKHISSFFGEPIRVI